MKSTRFFINFCIIFFSVLNTAWADDAEIRVGATLPLSGPLATYGQLIRGGIELAIEDLKSEGIDVKFFTDDTPYAGNGIIQSLRKLVSIDRIQGIVGNFSNVCMATMAPEIGKIEIPTLHTAAADQLISESNDWVLTTNIKIADEAQHVAQYIYGLGIRKIAVLSINVNFGQEYRNAFIAEMKKLGGTIVADETFEKDDPDYRVQLTKIRASKPEAIYHASFGHFLGFSLKQAAQLGLQPSEKLKVFSVYEAEDQSVIDAATGTADGLQYFVTYESPELMSEKIKKFQERYKQKLGRVPGTFGSNAYDATILMVHALKKCSGNNICTRDELYKTADYPGMSGTFSMRPDGTAKKVFRRKKIQGGGFVDQ